MSGRLEGKKIVVTAAGQGIGKATAIAFHNEGANVIATDLNDKTLADLNKEYPDITVQTLDSTDNNAILEFVKTLDRVDALFNAVGFVHHGMQLQLLYQFLDLQLLLQFFYLLIFRSFFIYPFNFFIERTVICLSMSIFN